MGDTTKTQRAGHAYDVGDSVEMLIGRAWHRCIVVNTWSEAHYSGQAIVGYMCRFPDGSEIPCGGNSLRRATNDRTKHP